MYKCTELCSESFFVCFDVIAFAFKLKKKNNSPIFCAEKGSKQSELISVSHLALELTFFNLPYF